MKRVPLLVVPAAVAALVLLTSSTVQAQVVLQNDGYVNGANVAFQGGFGVGERAASRLTPPGPFPMQILNVELLFGGNALTEVVTLMIFNDDGPGTAPGTLIHQSDWDLTGSAAAFNQIDLAALNVQVPGIFHVAIEFQHLGYPSVARDDDGSIQVGENFIYADLGGGPTWIESQFLGVTGDWIIRATVDAAPVGGADEPTILTIDDVGNDQGRNVRLRFARSDQDQAGAATPITQYEVLRRVDNVGRSAPGDTRLPALRLDGWDYVMSLPAHGEAIYSAVVPTLADSTIANGQHWSVFLVRAATASPVVFYDSAPDSGYSVDNLAPAAPGNLVFSQGEVAWDPAPEPDFDYFTVYGSDVPVLDGSETLLTQTTATNYAVGGAPHAYLLVTATDFSGNEGGAGVTDLATDAPAVASGVAALRAWPNPFRASTSVSFEVPSATRVRVSVFDAAGRLVRQLADGERGPGRHTLEWNGRDAAGQGVANGIYLVRLSAEGRVEQRKVVLLR